MTTLDLDAIELEEAEARPSFTHRAPVPIVASIDDDATGGGADDVPVRRPIFDAPSETLGESFGEPTGGEVPPLPHWTEPPTGAVPAIFSDDTGEHDVDDFDAWAPITGSTPRFRAEGSDWAEADFGDDLSGENERLGALSEAEPVDEEAEFAEALAQRRRRLPRAPRDRRGAAAATAAVATTAAPAARVRPPRRAVRPDADARRWRGTGARRADRDHDRGRRRDLRVGELRRRPHLDRGVRVGDRRHRVDRVQQRAAHEGLPFRDAAGVARERDDSARGQALRRRRVPAVLRA